MADQEAQEAEQTPEETPEQAEEEAAPPAPEESGGSPVSDPAEQAPAAGEEETGNVKPEEETKEEEPDTPAAETEVTENVNNNEVADGEVATTVEGDEGQTADETTEGETAPTEQTEGEEQLAGEEVQAEQGEEGEQPPPAEGEGDQPPPAEGDEATAEEHAEVQEGGEEVVPGKEETEGEEEKPKEEGEEAGEEGEDKPQEQVDGEEEPKDEEPKSPVPQSDTFTEGERVESPIGVGEKLSREGTPDSQARLSDRQLTEPDILEPGTPERSRPGSAEEEERERGQLEPFEEEEDEDDEEEEDEEPEFDRDALIERYHAAIAEREQLQQSNYQLQHKLADYFRKKKADESRQDYDKNVTDQEQRYLKYMAQLEDLRRQDMQERESYKLQIEDLRIKCEEKKEWVDEERKKFMEFKKQVALNSLNSRSGKPIPPKDIEQYLQTENRKEAEVVNVRLENIKLKNKLKKKEQQLKSKEELAEGLHLIDFEQLKIENQTYNEKIEERNEELLKLRKKITSTVQVLTHLKEKLQYVQAENHVHKGSLHDVEVHVAQKRDILSRTKQARDALRIDNTKLRQNCGLLGNEPLLRDFEERKDEGDDLRERLDQLKMQHAELTLNCNQVRRKIEQVRAGPS